VLPELINNNIKFELDEISSLFELYNELFHLKKSPSLLEITSMAGVLHSFYTGIEKVFLIVARQIDCSSPSGSNWHRELLNQMLCENKFRSQVISPATRDQLAAYMQFRHFFRHAYSNYLAWEEMKDLWLNLQDVWASIRNEIELFAADYGEH